MKARYVTVVVLLLITAFIVRQVSYDTYNNPEEGISAIAHIPMQLGQWHGTDLPLEENIYEILETRSIIHRSYSSSSGANVFLSIVYYTETKVDFHAPEACLGGQGLRVNKEEKTILVRQSEKEIPIRLNQLLRKGDGPDTLIWYFYKAGDFLGEDYIKLRLNLAFNKLANNAKSGALIRISTPIPSDPDGEVKASSTLRGFLEEILPTLSSM